MIKRLKQFIASDEGATAVEYVMMASLIAVIMIGAVMSLGTALQGFFTSVAAAI